MKTSKFTGGVDRLHLQVFPTVPPDRRSPPRRRGWGDLGRSGTSLNMSISKFEPLPVARISASSVDSKGLDIDIFKDVPLRLNSQNSLLIFYFFLIHVPTATTVSEVVT